MAPEIRFGKGYDSKVDVWSFGTLFYELITGIVPFIGHDLDDLVKTLETGNYWMPKDVNLSLEGLSFLNSCLKYKPEDRMSLDEMINHSYLDKNSIDESFQGS
jgi:serine/threonine protein kinase